MTPKQRKHVIPQMFDVRPVDRSGALDWDRIGSVGSLKSTTNADDPVNRPKAIPKVGADEAEEMLEFGRPDAIRPNDRVYRPLFDSNIDFPSVIAESRTPTYVEEDWDAISDSYRNEAAYFGAVDLDDSQVEHRESHREKYGLGAETFQVASDKLSERSRSTISSAMLTAVTDFFRSFRFPIVPYRLIPVAVSGEMFRSAMFLSIFLFILFGGIWSVQRMFLVKSEVMKGSIAGVSYASQAVDDLTSADFDSSVENFDEAHRLFSETSASLGLVGNELAKAVRFIPGLSKVSSGQGLLEGAKHLSSAGASLSGMLALLPPSPPTPGDRSEAGDISFLDLVDAAERESVSASREIKAAQQSFDRVRVEDVPEDQRETFLSMKERLPVIAAALDGFNSNSHLIRELLGANGPRLYLFLFQNNAELRPTGGFIGSYGLLKVNCGHIEKFFVDGIFNPDGQLKENIVPPGPVQKVSTAWSLHDSNWWPDFPTSAEKAVFFYEKTGGPTVDGVVTLTPTVIRELLRLTGPVDMPDYGVTIDADNFLPVIQEEVEEKYDRELNQPKKILSDLAPILLDRLFSLRGAVGLRSLSKTLSDALGGKHILLYSRNAEVESLIDKTGWSGRMLDTPRDYLSVIHTNLNGYKTDAVMRETIEHDAVIRSDGSVLDTVRITRKHTGGDTPYDWFNKVNSDYLRVYVPEGSELVSASGQTYEFPKSPVDYDKLGFRRDKDVERDESSVRIDRGGTRISVESGKTVFGNWVYVSPGESVTVEYVYRLPFRVVPKVTDPASYSVLFQKQSGTEGGVLRSRLSVPDRFLADWVSDGTQRERDGYSYEATLSTDAYYGIVFSSQ